MDNASVSFWAAKLAGQMILPPNGPIFLALLGLLLVRRWPRTGRTLGLIGVGTLMILCLPVVAMILTVVVTEARALPPDAKVQADAIVILGAGVRTDAAEYGGDTVTQMGLERVRYGAILAKRFELPVATAGGVVYDGRPEGDVMAEVLEREFGVKVRWRETASRNTRQNARNLAGVLAAEKIRRIVVVTHGVDTRRARRELEAAGFTVVMAPTVVQPFAVGAIWDFVPSMNALRVSSIALYEMLGNLKASWDGVP